MAKLRDDCLELEKVAPMRSRNAIQKISKNLVAAVTVGLSLLVVEAKSDTFGWGDIDANDVTFLDVTEDNDEVTSFYAPHPGSGAPITFGNSLRLFPSQQGFSSEAFFSSVDVIDSTLSTIIQAKSCSSLNALNIFEFGEYNLDGFYGGESYAQVAGSFFWTVLEIDNVPVSLATQATNLIVDTGSGPNGGQFSRPIDDGNLVFWEGMANIDVAAYLDSIEISGEATAVELTFDSTLQTSADFDSGAFIRTNLIVIDADVHSSHVGTDCDGDGDVDGADFLQLQRRRPELIPLWKSLYGTTENTLSSTSAVVPEPNSLLLLVLSGVCGRTCFRRR